MNKNEDYGTYFYKLRNGSKPFEYGVETRLDNISQTIDKGNKDIFCGLISAIVAQYVSTKLENENNFFVFLASLLATYFILQISINLFYKIKENYSSSKKNNIIEANEEELSDFKELFYHKILVEATYVFSVVHRSDEVKASEEKKRLSYMYAVQGLYEIKKIRAQLINASKKFSNIAIAGIVDEVGTTKVIRVFELIDACLTKIKTIVAEDAEITKEAKALEDSFDCWKDMITEFSVAFSKARESNENKNKEIDKSNQKNDSMKNDIIIKKIKEINSKADEKIRSVKEKIDNKTENITTKAQEKIDKIGTTEDEEKQKLKKEIEDIAKRKTKELEEKKNKKIKKITNKRDKKTGYIQWKVILEKEEDKLEQKKIEEAKLNREKEEETKHEQKDVEVKD